MTHEPESTFEKNVADWFRDRWGEERVETQLYQPGPRWFVDIVVDVGYATLFIECESRASEVRSGIAQAMGYAAADPVRGVPMVVTPKGHLVDEKVDRLRRSSTVVVREFDEEEQSFV